MFEVFPSWVFSTSVKVKDDVVRVKDEFYTTCVLNEGLPCREDHHVLRPKTRKSVEGKR